MKRLTRIIYHIGRIVHRKTKITLRNRLGLLSAYLRMSSKRLILVDLLRFNPQHEHFLGYFVHCYSYVQLISLFEEIFIREEDYFETGKSRIFIIDGGAHIGMTVLYFKMLYPHAKILAFEPESATYELLSRNILINHLRNVTVVNKALSNRSGKTRLYHDAQMPGSTISSLLPTRYHTESEYVETTNLSPYIKYPIDFMKLDIEGMEIPVLAELAKTGKLGKVHRLCIEYHHHIPHSPDVFSRLLLILERQGFRYQITTEEHPPVVQSNYQDIMVYASKL